MSLDADVLILGGGCAGLSLATALTQHAPHLHVVTLEQRTAYVRDRTWSFWNTSDNPFQAGITHRWHQWRVCAPGGEVRQQSKRFCYQHLPADNFYALAQDALARGHQQLVLGMEVTGVSAKGDHFETTTGRGLLRSRWVFDARTPEQGTAVPALWQRFQGWHVRTEQPCFNPACVDLMDFQTSGTAGRTVFFYLLPFSAREALVEITYLDRPDLEPEDGRERLRQRLHTLCPAGDYEVLFTEAGALPMGAEIARQGNPSPAIAIGTRGGRVKPSSGYAFQRIQRQSQAIAQALGQGSPLPQQVEPAYYAWLDRIFLVALQHHPQRIPHYFLELFRNVSPSALIPFLSETADLRAILTTVLALPRRDFLHAALFPAEGAAR